MSNEGTSLRHAIFWCTRFCVLGHRLTFLRIPGVNRQGQAHIVSTAIPLPRSGKTIREVEVTPWFRTWSIDPQPASISPTINISIDFISLGDCGRIICHPAIKKDAGAILSAGRAARESLDRLLEAVLTADSSYS